MPKSSEAKPIIDIQAVAERLQLSPEKAKQLGETFFAGLAGRKGSLSDALLAASRAAKVKPKQLTELLSAMADDFARPLPEAPASIGKRLSNAADEAREKASETVDRISKGVSSIDVAALRKEGSDKVAELRERAANIDTADLSDQAKELGDKATDGARDLAGKLSRSIASVMPKGVTGEAKK
ncbi:hypothetical protein MTsPCn7_27570 [Altererythrobacter sp. MTPC7]